MLNRLAEMPATWQKALHTASARAGYLSSATNLKNKGYTLLELVLVLSLITLLTTLGLPAYQKWLAQHRAMTQANRLITAIQFARSEAVTRNIVVTLCPSSDGQHCNNKWQDGWIIFTDAKVTGKFKPGDQILRVYDAISTNDRLLWRASRSTQYLQLSPTGSTYGQQGTFIYCSSANKIATQIVISQTGRIRVSNTEDAHCV